MQNMITGSVGSIEPGVKPSRFERCPSWKIHTIAPNEAEIESRFITTAFSGRTIEPRSRKSTNIVAAMM